MATQFSNSPRTPPLFLVGERLAGAKITGYGGCYNARIAHALQALPFYRIKVDSLSFTSQSANLECPTLQYAQRAVSILQRFPKVVDFAEAGGYHHSPQGWVSVSFVESPWYTQDGWRYSCTRTPSGIRVQCEALNGFLRFVYSFMVHDPQRAIALARFKLCERGE